jgi:general secretion pathway protein N
MLRLRKCAHRSGAMLALAVAFCGPSESGVPEAPENARAAIDSARDAAAPLSANPLWAIPLDALSATGERPIFSPSRRRPAPATFEPAAAEPPKPVPAPPEPSRPPLVLVGTIVGESRQIGIFREETTEEMVRLATGEGHSGWLLRSVDNRGVQFERGERSTTLVLRPPHQSKAPGSEAGPTAELIPPVRRKKRDRSYDPPAMP